MTIAGDPVTLSADLATPLGLVLHELATNAAKHGSLSVPKGNVSLTWAVKALNGAQVLNLVWEEKNGPKVAAPSSAGKGTSLVDAAVPGAKVEREFRRGGLRCTIMVPLGGS